jgi:hypothetical protein
LEKPSKRGGHSLTAELFDGGVVGAKGRILAVFSPFETGDTENPLLFGEKGQKGGVCHFGQSRFLAFFVEKR